MWCQMLDRSSKAHADVATLEEESSQRHRNVHSAVQVSMSVTRISEAETRQVE